MTTMLNGWDVDAVTEAVTQVQEQPEAGVLTWRGRTVWDGGFGLDVQTRQIEQLGETMERHFTLRGDRPQELLGNNTGATAIETALAALGACMTGTFAVQATARGVTIDDQSRAQCSWRSSSKEETMTDPDRRRRRWSRRSTPPGRPTTSRPRSRS